MNEQIIDEGRTRFGLIEGNFCNVCTIYVLFMGIQVFAAATLGIDSMEGEDRILLIVVKASVSCAIFTAPALAAAVMCGRRIYSASSILIIVLFALLPIVYILYPEREIIKTFYLVITVGAGLVPGLLSIAIIKSFALRDAVLVPVIILTNIFMGWMYGNLFPQKKDS